MIQIFSTIFSFALAYPLSVYDISYHTVLISDSFMHDLDFLNI